MTTERAAPSVVVRGADFALSRSLRGMKLTLQAAAATKSAVDAEMEALQAFGTRQYAARALQVTTQPWFSVTLFLTADSAIKFSAAARRYRGISQGLIGGAVVAVQYAFRSLAAV